MNEIEREREFFEMGLRRNISYEEEELRKIVIMEAKILLEIIKNAVKSQDPEVLTRGLNHCHFLQGIMAVSGIKHNEINSSKKEIELLETEITQRLFDSGALIIVGEVRREEPDKDNKLNRKNRFFKNHRN